jgi:hypothetical protein
MQNYASDYELWPRSGAGRAAHCCTAFCREKAVGLIKAGRARLSRGSLSLRRRPQTQATEPSARGEAAPGQRGPDLDDGLHR